MVQVNYHKVDSEWLKLRYAHISLVHREKKMSPMVLVETMVMHLYSIMGCVISLVQ